MKKHYRTVAKKLEQALRELERIERDQDLPALHRFVVNIKTFLPETWSYQYSQILLDGLRVERPGDITAYANLLRPAMQRLLNEYKARQRD